MGNLRQTIITEGIAPGALLLADKSGLPVEFVGAYFVLTAAYAIAHQIKPTETDEFYKKLIKKVPDLATEIQKSKEFQIALAKTFEQISETRTGDKLEIVQNIFLNKYIPAHVRENVDLERYYQVLNDISIPALEHLYFIKKTIFPFRHAEIIEKLEHIQTGFPEIYTRDFYYKQQERQIPISHTIMAWINENYGLESPRIKGTAPNDNSNTASYQIWSKKIADEKNDKSNKFNEYAIELESLGIFHARGDVYQISDFGRKLIKFIPGLVINKKSTK